MTDHVVVGKRSGYASAEVVARTPHQRRDLVDMLVLPDQEQTEVWFGIQGQPKRWMRTGFADLAWVSTAQRPTSVDWMPINALVWELTDDGQVHVPDPAH